MGRGRQKAKQQKIARKLKYLTTDTDYDELAKELGAQTPGAGSFDPFADIEERYAQDADNGADEVDEVEEVEEDLENEDSETSDDLDEYAKWAAEAAAKATSGEMPVTTPVHHKPIPMPVPEALKHHEHEDGQD